MIPYALISIDPSLRRTGAAVYRVSEGARPDLPLARSDTYRALDRYRELRTDIEEAVGDLRWFAVLEKPTPRGGGLPPTAAFHDWQAWLQDFARARAGAAGERYRKPMILTPAASQWRAPLGLATRAPRGFAGTHDERRAYLKWQAVRYAKIVTGHGWDADTAEAVCQALWALRCAKLDAAPKRGGGFEPIRYVA